MGCLLLYLPNGRVAWIATALLIVGYKLGLVVDTIRIARRRERANRWYQRWWFYLCYVIATQLVLLGIVQVSRTYWGETFVIPTGSMAPTILAGDRIFVDKLRYRSTPIRRGDVIVFWIDNRHTYFAPAPRRPDDYVTSNESWAFRATSSSSATKSCSATVRRSTNRMLCFLPCPVKSTHD